MKKLSIPFLILCAAGMLFSGAAFSQLSEGGTPLGYKFIKDKQLTAVSMPAINVDSMLAEDAANDQYKNRPYRFGYNHLVNLSLTNSGQWTTLPNGWRIWQLDIKATGAYTINLAFSHFNMPAGGRLFIYTKDRSQLLGAFTAKNNLADKLFGTELLNSDEVVIEYDEPAEVSGQGTLNLFRVTQGYKDLNHYLKSFGDAGACIHNVNCPQYSAWATEKRAVVCLVSGGNEFCSGSLVNNTANNGTPYILTANHCGTADNTWIFRFNWEAPGCPNPSTTPASQSISGGTPIANNVLSDFNLVRMSAVPPANFNAYYAGWSHSFTPATSVTGIHHPSGDIKKLSQANNAVVSNTYDAGNGTAQVWQIGQWTDGVTEPGSSGSPLFDQNHHIVGQLYGGPSFCGATGTNLSDNYGKFCISWDTGTTAVTRLRDWLDPINTGAITNDGYDPNVAVIPLDAALTNIVSPTGTSCNLSVTAIVTLRNVGINALTSATINYHLNGNISTAFNWSGSLASGQSADVNLGAITAAAGTSTFFATVSSPNGSADPNAANDSVSGNFTVIVPTPVPTPFAEGFEGPFLPTGWTKTTPASGATWAKTAPGAFGTSSHSVVVDESAPASNTTGEKSDLITPFIDFSNITGPAFLSFDVAYARYDANNSDTLNILASNDCGATWTSIYYKGGSDLATAADNTNTFTPASSEWRRDSIDVSAYLGVSPVQFDFQQISGWGNAMYIDNVNIHGSGFNSIAKVDDNIALLNVFPNPIADAFTIQLSLSQQQTVTSDLYSVEGKLIKHIANEKLEPGVYNIPVTTGQLSSGVYLLKVNYRFVKLEK